MDCGGSKESPAPIVGGVSNRPGRPSPLSAEPTDVIPLAVGMRMSALNQWLNDESGNSAGHPGNCGGK
jgi:hypothetical protein